MTRDQESIMALTWALCKAAPGIERWKCEMVINKLNRLVKKHSALCRTRKLDRIPLYEARINTECFPFHAEPTYHRDDPNGETVKIVFKGVQDKATGGCFTWPL